MREASTLPRGLPGLCLRCTTAGALLSSSEEELEEELELEESEESEDESDEEEEEAAEEDTAVEGTPVAEQHLGHSHVSSLGTAARDGERQLM